MLFTFQTLKYVTSPSPIINNIEFGKFKKVYLPLCFNIKKTFRGGDILHKDRIKYKGDLVGS